MSWFFYDPDEYEIVSNFRPCDFHAKNPGKFTPFCTCYGAVGNRRRSDEEIAVIRERKRIAHEDAVLVEADEIRWRRGLNA